jgi:hypothetical protein
VLVALSLLREYLSLLVPPGPLAVSSAHSNSTSALHIQRERERVSEPIVLS